MSPKKRKSKTPDVDEREAEIAAERYAEIQSGVAAPIIVGQAAGFQVRMHPDCELPDGMTLEEMLGVLAEVLGGDKKDSGMN